MLGWPAGAALTKNNYLNGKLVYSSLFFLVDFFGHHPDNCCREHRFGYLAKAGLPAEYNNLLLGAGQFPALVNRRDHLRYPKRYS